MKKAKKKVAYIYDTTFESTHFPKGHVMKPKRAYLTNAILESFDAFKLMDLYVPLPIPEEKLLMAHDPEYLNLLKTPFVPGSSEPLSDDLLQRLQEHGLMDDCNDCPLIPGVFEFASYTAAASVAGAQLLNDQQADIVINYGGGLHHAKKAKASGFCFINDANLGIIELKPRFRRIVYVDVDYHAGDGVEEGWYWDPTVLTVSFHAFIREGFIKGVGPLDRTGEITRTNYTINVPCQDGLTDKDFQDLFETVMDKVNEVYAPEVYVLQCGGDSLAQDPVGTFNLSMAGHAFSVAKIKSLGKPMLVLGGGGYSVKNVAKLWAYETMLLCDKKAPGSIRKIDATIPFSDNYTLLPKLKTYYDNKNTRADIQFIKETIVRNISSIVLPS